MKSVWLAAALVAWNAWAAAPPPLADLPAFSLTTSEGKPFTKKDLKGSAWVVDFIFTRCQGQCPLLNEKMLRMKRELKDLKAFRVLSITVDPKYDRPKILAAYAKGLGVSPADWVFTTGEKVKIDSLIRDGFKLAGGNGDEIAHSARFVLVDGQGRIRGYYQALEDEKLAELKKDLGELSAEAN